MLMMLIWVLLPIASVVLAGIYLFFKLRGVLGCFLPDLSGKKQKILSAVAAAVLVIPAFRIYDTWFIILVHLIIFSLIIDGIAALIRRLRKSRKTQDGDPGAEDDRKKSLGVWAKLCRSGILAVLLTALFCGYGHYNMLHVIRTEYTVSAQKSIREESYKIVLLSDLHYGISLDDSGLQAAVERINSEAADLVILDGDIVDESTTKEQMESAFSILGQAKSTYGIYYVYGNHDKNNYTSNPNYTREQLASVIEANGIRILEDEAVSINSDLALIGRADRGETAFVRKSIAELTGNLDKDQEWIVLDHQPTDYAAVKEARADLILSGHTHAGQIWPAGFIARLFRFDDLNYGEKQDGNLDAIVTSGIAGWGYPIRTEKHSEYVVIKIRKE